MKYIHSLVFKAKNRVRRDEERSHTAKMTEAMYLQMARLLFYTCFRRKLSTLTHETYGATKKFESRKFYPQNWTL